MNIKLGDVVKAWKMQKNLIKFCFLQRDEILYVEARVIYI